MEIVSKSASQTQKIGEELVKTLKGGDVVALYGDLGAGKTVFVKGIAKGLGIKKRILSPTFFFVRSYPLNTGTFHHVDLYRAQNLNELEALGLPEIFSPDAIVVIEWADRIAENLPKKRIDVTLTRENETARRIRITNLSSPPLPLSSPPFPLSFPRKRESEKAAHILKSGGIVIFPTDTVYGIGCRWDLPKSVERIYKIKNTPKSQAFPILVSSIDQARKLVKMNKTARKLMDNYWPGALTIILSTKEGDRKIGLRLSGAVVTRALIEQVGVPIIGTSANIHGKGAPTTSSELDPDLIKQVDYVLKGECEGGIESTVVDATEDPPKILRQGAIRLMSLNPVIPAKAGIEFWILDRVENDKSKA